jgi:alkylhydroperoxidase/carboxymuconolactone decarboxylase family protein YurZ
VGHRDGAFGLCRRAGRILLVRNDRVTADGMTPTWDLPGGAVRGGERLDDALRREWREETGLDGDVGTLLLVVDGAKRRAEDAAPLYTWRAFTFEVACEGEARPGPGIAEVAWVPEHEAAARLTAPYHAPLRERLAGGEGAYGRVSWVEQSATPNSIEERFRRLLAIGAAAAVGNRDLLAQEAAAAVAAQEPPTRIEETLLQVVPYAGFPRALTAFGVVRPRLGRAGPAIESRIDQDLLVRSGRGTFDRVYADAAERVEAGLRGFHSVLPAWTLEFAYGRVLARPGLTLLEREVLAVAMLAAMGGMDEPLLGHMRAAVRLGATRDLVAGALDVAAGVAGEARREEARPLLDRL